MGEEKTNLTLLDEQFDDASSKQLVFVHASKDYGDSGRFYTPTRDMHHSNISSLRKLVTVLNPMQIENKSILVNQSTNFAIENNSAPHYPLCGFPTFCTDQAMDTCRVTALKDCEECSMTQAWIFATVYVAFGLLIVAGNGLVLWNVIMKRKGFDDTYSKIRASLAVADILSGLQIFAVILYNFAWTIGATAREIDFAEASMRGSTNAEAGGIFYLLGLTSSLYHLVFLSSQRLYAIAFPFHYKVRSTVSVYVGLIIVWMLASLSAIFPVWFSESVTFTYQHSLFIYFPTHTEKALSSSSYADIPALVSLVLLLFVPYLLMTCLSFASGAMVHLYYQKRAKKFSASQMSRTNPKRISKHEVHIIKTVIVMQIGFTVTLLPLAIAATMFYTGFLTCSNFSTPYFICFYLSLSHSGQPYYPFIRSSMLAWRLAVMAGEASLLVVLRVQQASLVNVLAYIALSSKFRASIARICCASFPRRWKRKAKEVAMSGVQNNLSTSQTKSSDLSKSSSLKIHATRSLPGVADIEMKEN